MRYFRFKGLRTVSYFVTYFVISVPVTPSWFYFSCYIFTNSNRCVAAWRYPHQLQIQFAVPLKILLSLQFCVVVTLIRLAFRSTSRLLFSDFLCAYLGAIGESWTNKRTCLCHSDKPSKSVPIQRDSRPKTTLSLLF